MMSVVTAGAMMSVMMAAACSADEPDAAIEVRAVEGLFEALKQATAKGDEGAFKTGWHPAGWAENVVGGSGLAGEAVFRQGSRKGWYLRADAASVRAAGRQDVVIVRCDVWSTKKEKAVDEVFVVVVRHDERVVALGGGEDRDEVEALAGRFIAGGALAPSKD